MPAAWACGNRHRYRILLPGMTWIERCRVWTWNGASHARRPSRSRATGYVEMHRRRLFLIPRRTCSSRPRRYIPDMCGCSLCMSNRLGARRSISFSVSCKSSSCDAGGALLDCRPNQTMLWFAKPDIPAVGYREPAGWDEGSWEPRLTLH